MMFHFAALPVRSGVDAEQALPECLGVHRVLSVARHVIGEPDQTAVTSGSGYWRALQGPRRASSGGGSPGERSPGLRFAGSRTDWP
jgi:hypothetical protein